MYNQYLGDSDFVLLEPEQQAPSPPPRSQPSRQEHGHSSQNRPGQPRPGQGRTALRPDPIKTKNDLIGEITGGLGQLLDGVLKHVSLENFDTGDILLVLIILFLYLEGDNLELVITLGLLLLLGLGGDKPKQDGEG